MPAKRICLLHSIDDAEHFLATHGRGHGYRLYSTHCSVVDHLAEMGLSCEEVSARITHEDNLKIRQSHWPGGNLHDETRRLLAALDACVPADFQVTLGLRQPVALFTFQYDYLLARALTGKTLFFLALDRILTDAPAEEMLVYEQDIHAPYFSAHDVLEQLLVPKHNIFLATARAHGREALAKFPMHTVKPRLQTYARAAAKRLSALFQRRAATATQPGAAQSGGRLLLFPEADLQDLPSLPLPFELLIWPPGGLPELPGEDLPQLRAKILPLVSRITDALGSDVPPEVPPRFWERFRSQFAQRGEELLLALVLLDRLLGQRLVDAAAWGFSPGSEPRKNLLVQYMLACGLPVAGMQHGGNYGVQNCGYMHVLSDYSKCSLFFTHGFTREDVPAEFGTAIRCALVPVGSLQVPSGNLVGANATSKGRVVYPPFFGVTQLAVGDLRSPSQIAADQALLLQTLENRTDLDIWIKPHPNASPSTLACPGTMRRLKHARIAGGGFTWFLTQMRPQLVVIDFPSSTLFEALPFDVDIFLLLDPMYRFTPEAERMLRERAHVFETATDMALALQKYAREPLPRLRSDEYYARFIHRPGAKERLTRELAAWSQTWTRPV